MKLKNTSWNQVKNSKKIKFIQDPILNIEITKEYFEDIYKYILNKIDGNSENIKNSIDYYFYINPLKSNTILFINDNKKKEFYELGMKPFYHYTISNKLISEILKNKD